MVEVVGGQADASELPPEVAVDVEPGGPIEAVQPDAGDVEDVVEPFPAAPAAPAAPVVRPGSEGPAVRRIDQPEPEPVDLVSTAGSAVARRLGPVLAIIAVVWILRKLFSRNRHER
jgi:hypothetical protein